ncbi:MAG: BrnA antitoxin family protein [Syntrophales bacterium]
MEFFRRKGRGYQSSINAILRRYMEVQRRRLKNT